MVQMAQGIARPLFSVMLGVELFCEGVQFFENFTLCDLTNFDVILGNTFLDAYKIYKINIFCSGRKLKLYAKCGSKLMNLNVDYNSILAKMGVILVALTGELESPSFLILMYLRFSQGEPKPQATPYLHFGFIQ
jgi:hypothetical protein